MTLKELIECRGHKFDKEIGVSCSDHWNGYKTGWFNAYRDIREILEYHGFDLDHIVYEDRKE